MCNYMYTYIYIYQKRKPQEAHYLLTASTREWGMLVASHASLTGRLHSPCYVASQFELLCGVRVVPAHALAQFF